MDTEAIGHETGRLCQFSRHYPPNYDNQTNGFHNKAVIESSEAHPPKAETFDKWGYVNHEAGREESFRSGFRIDRS